MHSFPSGMQQVSTCHPHHHSALDTAALSPLCISKALGGKQLLVSSSTGEDGDENFWRSSPEALVFTAQWSKFDVGARVHFSTAWRGEGLKNVEQECVVEFGASSASCRFAPSSQRREKQGGVDGKGVCAEEFGAFGAACNVGQTYSSTCAAPGPAEAHHTRAAFGFSHLCAP